MDETRNLYKVVVKYNHLEDQNVDGRILAT